MTSVKERCLRYVRVDTQSKEDVPEVPSTEKQLVLLGMLRDELAALGAVDVKMDGHGYVTATVPANDGGKAPVMGLIAHADTATEVSGADVHPVLTKNYSGGDIEMGNGYVLSPSDYPYLLDHVGEEVICTDGTTLLGADDKAGVAEIMTACERLLRPDAPKHGALRVCFTPDEEVGNGTKYFDVKGFGAEFAYTVDGGPLGDVSYENFNAAGCSVTFRGVSIHPGSAKGKMVNAILLAMEFHALLPAHMDPACTEGHEGFFHPASITGETDRARLHYLIRDHDRDKFEEKKRLIRIAERFMNEKYGEGTVRAEIRDRYFNMKEKVDPKYVEAVMRAMEACGVKPLPSPIRGGTDGANLSYMGLPCPNICTGGYNFHGRYEFITTEAMEKVTDILVRLVCSFADR